MAGLSSWLSANVMQALGWALIHSLWQCVGLAALAAILMTLSRRPAVRYLIASGALIAMLAAPAATFLILMKPAAPVQALIPAGPSLFVGLTAINPPDIMPAAHDDLPKPVNHGAAFALPPRFLSSNFLPADFLPPNILPWLVGAWLCGVALFSLRVAGGFLLLEHRRRQCRSAGPYLLALCQTLQRQLGLNRAIRYLECGWLQAPAVIGWLRPIMLLPVSALTGLTEAQLRAVIAHELAHIRRHDFFVNLLQVLIETLLFYHPAVWWLNKRIRAERELCCDEIAVSLTGDRLEYAKVLTLMAEWESAPALAMAANRGPLSERIFHILGRKPFGAGQRILGLTGSLLFLAAALGAANALFGIAYPIPMAHAKADLKAALSSSRIAAVPLAEPVLPAPSAKAVPADSAAEKKADATDASDTDASPQEQAAATAPAETLKATFPDLSRLVAAESPAMPRLLASGSLPAAMRSRSCAVPSVADKVALRQVPGSDLMTVPVEINGATKQFLLDFDTDPTEISEPTVAELHLPNVGRNAGVRDMDGSNSPSLQAPFFNVKGADAPRDYRARVLIGDFTMGDATVHDLQFLVADDRDMGRSAPYDGRLTRSHFPQYDIDLDFGAKQLSFLTPTSCADPDQVAYWPHTAVATVPMSLSGGKMQVQVTIGGHQIEAVIDTGSARTVMRRDVAELLFGLKAGTPDMTQAGDLRDGNGMQVYSHTFPQISFAGGVTANNVPALIQTSSMVHKIDRTPILGSRAQFIADPSERIPELALGMDVLHQLHLYAAFDQNKLYVTSAEPRLYALSAE